MKNLKVVESKKEIKDYIYKLWSTDVFRKSHKEKNGYINKLVDKFADYPRFFAEMSNKDIEWSQFYSYFNILMERTYHNKTVQDLYYLHEINHMATMLYDKSLDFDSWQRKMIDNEMESSIESEILVYDKLDIRGSSFNFEIWYDSLPKELMKDRSKLIQHRFSRMKSPTTNVEITLNKYFTNNKVWVDIWRKNYPQVEEAMGSFYSMAKSDPKKAIKRYWKFIEKNTTDQVMFKEEAEKFSKIYLNNY